MRQLLYFFLIVTACYSCDTNGDLNQCDSSKKSLNLFGWLEESYGDDLKSIEHEAILTFPNEVKGDSTKCGIRSVITLNKTKFTIDEYSFSDNYIEDHALTATLGEFFFPPKRKFPYSQVFNELNGRCIVFKINKKQYSDKSEKLLNEIVDHYRKL